MGERLAHGLEQWFLVLGARELKTTEKNGRDLTQGLEEQTSMLQSLTVSGVDKGIMEQEGFSYSAKRKLN